MKNIALIFIMALSATLVFAQTKERDISNAEKFSAKAGALMQKEFLVVGEINSAKIEIVYYTDLISMQKQSAVKFEYESQGKYTSDTKVAVLDADEIDAFIKSVKLMQEKIFPSVPTNYTEVSYKSRGGFEAGCFWSKGNWSTFLKLEKFDKDSYVFLSKDDFPKLLTLLEQAKAKLL